MRHIMVVEDDPHNATLFRKILEKRGGYRVSITEEPAELFAGCAAGEFDLVLMDVSLSHSRWQGEPVNGTDLCRMLKADPRTASIPVILATAHAMRGDAESLLVESGADGYVSKPVVDQNAFIAQVRGLLAEAA
jgi:two-component system, cell cycle response regulator DivK